MCREPTHQQTIREPQKWLTPSREWQFNIWKYLKTSRQNGSHYSDDIFKFTVFCETLCNFMRLLTIFFHQSSNKTKPVLVQEMAWLQKATNDGLIKGNKNEIGLTKCGDSYQGKFKSLSFRNFDLKAVRFTWCLNHNNIQNSKNIAFIS